MPVRDLRPKDEAERVKLRRAVIARARLLISMKRGLRPNVPDTDKLLTINEEVK